MILVTKWFGTFLCDREKITDMRLFPKDVESIADRMGRIRRGEILEEELELGKRASSVAEKRLGRISGVTAFDSSFIRPEKFGYDKELLRQASMKLARESLVEEDPGAYISEQIRAYDDLIGTCNLMSERLREWYGLHFPELEKRVDDRKYVELIAANPSREIISQEVGMEEESAGAEMTEEDLQTIRALAISASEMFRARSAIESSIQSKMKKEAINLSAVAGPIIGARLISLSGGMARLARMPTSTIQLLGAEKAMFRHLKDGSRPPKHGIIFQHPNVHKAPYWQRGKIARTLAGRISLAAKADFYSDRDLSSELVAYMDRRIEEIRKRYPNPPKREARSGKKRRSKGGKRR
ncbi:MAG TPA: ribosomal biogenesis protein [Euryarchaeota archaeon]|nr:ribosomal biogenesis protein [Euryarchaeota archaeon]